MSDFYYFICGMKVVMFKEVRGVLSVGKITNFLHNIDKISGRQLKRNYGGRHP